MVLPLQFRSAPGSRRAAWLLLAVFTVAAGAQTAAPASSPAPQPPAAAAPEGPPAAGAHTVEPQPDKRQLREAEDAYLSGAKKLEHNDLDGAETDFQRALKLDPGNRNYAIAISITRQHRLTGLVQQAAKDRQAGDAAKAAQLLDKARTLDPTSPIVLEHAEPVPVKPAPVPPPPAPAPGKPVTPQDLGAVLATQLAERGKILPASNQREPWPLDVPVLAGAIHVKPTPAVKSFNLRSTSTEVLRSVPLAYGIRAVVDDSVARKDVRFNLENATYAQAMNLLMSMTQSFAVPLDETSILIAKDDDDHRSRLERQLEETVNVPGSSTEQLNELANVVRNMFDIKQVTVQAGSGSILIRAPEDIMTPLNATIAGLTEAAPEVLLEVRMYEVDSTGTTNIGAAIPTQFNVFNVEETANSIVSQNQTLVQQAVAQGYIPAGTSNLQIALALIGLGLVKSSLATNLIGVIGGGIVQTGISASTNTTFNLALNSTDNRSLDDVQMRIGDKEEAVFREGTRYPITSSTYSSGLSTAASSLAGQTINGVPVSSLLSQFAGGTSATIPQVTYEDLGVTLDATPSILRMGRINLKLNLKIEALSGSTNDGNPVLENRQFASVLTLNDGESALMVSNVTRSELAAMTGIPGLSELPGFQMPTERTGEKDTSQLVLLVTPHVVRTRADRVAGPRIAIRAAPEE
jgi:Flp pilus assembly secretin CpaC/tetratricopeptide (TPR) repeat protein